MRTFLRRGAALTAGALLVLFVFASSIRDSTQEDLVDGEGRPRLGTALRFEATAYCKGTTTAAGTAVRAGIAAADPSLLPLGSVVRVDAPIERYSGIWTVMDTGPEVKGREIDLYVWSCHDALAFGRRGVRVTILRLGWDPQQSAPGGLDLRFRRREAARPAPPAEPPPAESSRDAAPDPPDGSEAATPVAPSTPPPTPPPPPAPPS
jgi:3D (Asp-Asp-Asp) domain-containing protein